DADELVGTRSERVGQPLTEVDGIQPGSLARLVGPVQERDDRAGERPAGDEAGREQAPRADLLAIASLRSAAPVDDALDDAADPDRQRGREREVSADGEAQRRDAAQ